MKKNSGFSIVEILVVIVILVVVGAVGWIAYMRLTQPGGSNPTEARAVSYAKTPQEVTTKVKAALAAKYVLYEGSDDNYPDGHVRISNGDNSAAYKSSGDAYFITYKGGSSLSAYTKYDQGALPTAEDKVVRKIMSDAVKEAGLSYSGLLGGITASGAGVYAGNGIVCDVTTADYASSGSNVVCGSVDAYAREAAILRPLAAAVPSIDSTAVISRGNIEDSPVAGFQRGYIGIGDIQGLGVTAIVYKKGSGPWVLLKTTQNVLFCDDITTQDQKDAFTGETCYDRDGTTRMV